MNADILHQDMYTYDIYAEYLNKIEHYALNSTINSLSIRYYKQNIALTSGKYDDLDVIVPDAYSRVYDIFDFSPVLQMQPLNYTVDNDEQNQGVIRRTTGVLTLMAVIEPLPGDIFNFYQNQSTNEFFSVDTVNFVHSVKDLNLYELTFSTSNWTLKNIENIKVNEHYYYLKEFRKFYDSSLYDEYKFLLDDRNDMMQELTKSYDCRGFYTGFVIINNVEYQINEIVIKKLNSVLLYLNEKVKLDIKIILNYPIEYVNDLLWTLDEIDCYIDDPDYIQPNIPTVPYNPFEGKLKVLSVYSVYELQNIYLKFINYQEPLDGNIDTSGIINDEKVFKEDAINIIYDLNGNILP